MTTSLINASICSGIGCDTRYQELFFNLAKVNSVPCMFTAALFLG